MKGRSCCSTCLFTGGSISGRRPLIFKHGGHLSYGGRSGTVAVNAWTLAMCRSLAAAHSLHSHRMCSSVSSAFLQYGQQWEVIIPRWCAQTAVHSPPTPEVCAAASVPVVTERRRCWHIPASCLCDSACPQIVVAAWL